MEPHGRTRCLKCLGTKLTRTYHKEGRCRGFCGREPFQLPKREGEHLHVKCEACGFVWQELCADSGSNPSQPTHATGAV